MKAIILAAGYATRLYPLTLNQPKALLKIGEKAIIDYIVDELVEVPVVNEIFVVTNNKFANHFHDWAKNTKSAVQIKVLDDGTNTEESRLGAIGDILFTIKEENIDEDIIVIAGDNFFTYKLKDYYDFYEKTNKDCVVVQQIDDVEALKQFAVASLDENNKVIELVEKPAEPRSNIAVFATYIYKKETLELFDKYLQEGNKPDAPGYFVQWLYKIKDVIAYVMPGECYDIGTIESYEQVQKIFG